MASAASAISSLTTCRRLHSAPDSPSASVSISSRQVAGTAGGYFRLLSHENTRSNFSSPYDYKVSESRRVTRDEIGPQLNSGTREAAFTYAIISAGVAHQVARACKRGQMETCGRKYARIAFTKSPHQDARSAQRRLPYRSISGEVAVTMSTMATISQRFVP